MRHGNTYCTVYIDCKGAQVEYHCKQHRGRHSFRVGGLLADNSTYLDGTLAQVEEFARSILAAVERRRTEEQAAIDCAPDGAYVGAADPA